MQGVIIMPLTDQYRSNQPAIPRQIKILLLRKKPRKNDCNNYSSSCSKNAIEPRAWIIPFLVLKIGHLRLLHQPA